MSTILFIEDDVLLAECYARWLTADSHVVRHVLGSQAALDDLDEHGAPDIIMLDILLHGANGVQLLHSLRSHADLSAIPIVLCSSALPQTLFDMHAYGVRAMLDKSTLTHAKLGKAMRELL